MQPGDDFLLVSCADGAGPEAEEDARARRLSGSSDSARKSDGEKGQKDVEMGVPVEDRLEFFGRTFIILSSVRR